MPHHNTTPPEATPDDDDTVSITDQLLPTAGRRAGRCLKFPSQLADLDGLRWDLGWLALPKMDGNRCLIVNGRAFTASMRPFRSHQLALLLLPLLDWTENNRMFIDAEVYDPDGEHHADLSGALNSYDDPLPETTSIKIFDGGRSDWFYDQSTGVPYATRLESLYDWLPTTLPPTMSIVPHTEVVSADEVKTLYTHALADGYEGLILRSMRIQFHGTALIGGWYKHGRATVNQQIGFKMKRFETFDGRIIEVLQGQCLNQAAISQVERETNPDGTVSRRGLQQYMILDQTVGAFKVEWISPYTGERSVTEIGFGRGFNHATRRLMWTARDTLIGTWVEFDAMTHGAQEGARHGRLIRLRADKSGSLEDNLK